MSADQPQKPYFQQPAGLIGMLVILGAALFGGLVYPRIAPPNRAVATVSGESTTGKAVNAPGGRFNPIPLGSPFPITDAHLQVESMTRDMTEVVEQMNRFNRDPAPDEEWVLLNLIYACDLPPDQTCNVDTLDFDLEGQVIYNDNYVTVLENELAGAVPGGEQVSGTIGFIVDQADTDILLALNDPTGRIYFLTADAPA
jgi:hypothetical protein